MHSVTRFPLIVIIALLQTACGWVDSTGRQADGTGVDDDTLRLADGGTLALEEQVARLAQVPASTSTRGQWAWSPADQDADPALCADATAFDPSITETRLTSACASISECEVRFEELDAGDSLSFHIQPPRLIAPAVIEYLGTAVDELGNRTRFTQTLCIQSINEAPTARDDRYRMIFGETRSIDADAPDSLLQNDSDDEDVRNQPLTVDTTPVIAPRYAEFFSLSSDGGFRYRPSDDAPIDADGIARDSFTYLISDGLHSSTATAYIDIVEENNAPDRVTRVPDLDIALDELQGGAFEFVVADYFSDPDGDPLTYSTDSTLPGDGAIRLSDDGRLTGTLDADDVGRYRISIVASDGFATADDTFVLTVVTSHRPNNPPEADDIRNRLVSGSFEYDVSGFFEDPDGDALTFSATGLPDGVTISADGVISGDADDDNTGFWLIRVTADDGRGGTADDAFRLVIL